jgi:DNA-binding NarL/FixJ family response regulator
MHAQSESTTTKRRGRVLTVDDQPAFLAVVRELLAATDGLEAVAEAESGERAVELVQEIEPDMVLLDVWMPGINGVWAARQIKALRPSTIVVIVSITQPDELPALVEYDVRADAVLWKRDLRPRLLDDIWSRTQRRRGHGV